MRLPVVVAMLLLAAPALADDAHKRASELNAQAMTAYELGEYDKSAALLKQAYEVVAEPDILYNLARAYRSLKQYDKAIDAYKTYLRKKPGTPYKAGVQKMIAELEELQAAQEQSNQKPPTDMVPAPPQATQPAGAAAPSVPSPQEEGWYDDVVAWSLAGAGVVGLGLGVWMHVSANGLESDLATAPETDKQGIRDTINSRRTIGTIGLIAGGALLAGGVVKFIITGAHAGAEAAHAEIFIGAGTIGVAGRF
jgi:tetratricopeptide (TPR) repeat protein